MLLSSPVEVCTRKYKINAEELGTRQVAIVGNGQTNCILPEPESSEAAADATADADLRRRFLAAALPKDI